jgi:hypothetical protein
LIDFFALSSEFFLEFFLEFSYLFLSFLHHISFVGASHEYKYEYEKEMSADEGVSN